MIIKKHSFSFTIVEFLVVFGLIIFLIATAIFFIKPVNIFQGIRDKQRIQDIEGIEYAINIIAESNRGTFNELNYASSNVVYISLPDSSSTCSSWLSQLPSLPSDWSYRCSATPTDITGNGWIPIPFNSFSVVNLDRLPIDPINKPPYYYSFVVGGSYKLSAKPESNYLPAIQDEGIEPLLYEAGTNKKLSTFQSGLVGYWPFDEGSGTTTKDLSGYGIDLTILPSSSMVIWTSGKSGYGLKYNSSASTGCRNDQFGIYQDIPSTSILYKLPQNDFTIILWDNYNSGANTLFHLSTQYGITGCCNGFWVKNHSYIYVANSNKQDTGFSFSAPSNNIWHMYAYVFEKSKNSHRMYIDTIVRGSANNLSASYGDARKINIGIYDPTCVDAAKGTTFDEVRIYNRALSEDEIKALYEATK